MADEGIANSTVPHADVIPVVHILVINIAILFHKRAEEREQHYAVSNEKNAADNCEGESVREAIS